MTRVPGPANDTALSLDWPLEGASGAANGKLSQPNLLSGVSTS